MPKKQYPYQDLSWNNLPGEKWKDIPGLEEHFMVSNRGRIKRLDFEILCSNGQIRRVKSKMIQPELTQAKNNTVGDYAFFLRARISLHGVAYNISINRLVYYCFVRKFDLSDYSLVVLAKDGNGRNIHPANLRLTGLKQKQQRVFEQERIKREYSNSYDEYVQEGLTSSGNPYCRQVSQYTRKGERLATFPSIKSASQVTGVREAGIISVLKERQVSTSGFIWRYGDALRIELQDFLEKRNLHRKKLIGQPVTQYDNTGKKIASYWTIADASKAIGIGTGDISCVLSGKQRSAGGYIWKRGWGKPQIDLSNYRFGEQWRAQRRWKKVKQYDTSGKYIQTYPSVKAAAESLNILPSRISTGVKKQKPAAGFIWKYSER